MKTFFKIVFGTILALLVGPLVLVLLAIATAVLLLAAVFGLPALLLLGLIGYCFDRPNLSFTRHARRERARLDEEEARIGQELHQGLARMEKRIEALETLLLDRMSSATYRETDGFD